MKKLVFFVFFVLLSFAGFSQSKKISALPTAVNLNSSYVPIIQDSSGSYVNRKFPGNSFRTPLVSNGLSLDGDTVKLGGQLTEYTNITGNQIFDLNLAGVTNSTQLYTDSLLISLISSGATNGVSQINVHKDSLILNTRGEFKIRTELPSVMGYPIERLKIDSVGNVSMINTNTLNVLSSDDVNLTSVIGNRRTEYLNEITPTQATVSSRASNNDGSNYAEFRAVYNNGLLATSASLTAMDSLGNQSGLILSSDNATMSINNDIGSTGEYLGSDGAGGLVWGTPSDRRLKKNISPIHDASKKLLQLEPVNFTYKKSNEKTVGFIAQDVQKVLPEMVSHGKDGMLSLKNTTYLEPFIISTIQELEQRICELEKRLYKAEKKKHRPRYERKNQY